MPLLPAARDEFLALLEKIREDGTLVIVEGPNDKKALKHFGITNVISINKRALYKVIEQIVEIGREAIILTDLDKKGKDLYARFNAKLPQFGVKINNTLRHFMFRKTSLSQIEGMVSYLSRADAKTNLLYNSEISSHSNW